MLKDSTGNLFQPINHGTFDSLVAVIENGFKLRSIFRKTKEKLFTRPFKYRFRQKINIWPRKDPILHKCTMPFFDNDKWVIRRTQNISFALDETDYPVQFDKYLYIPNVALFLGLSIYSSFFIFLCFIPIIRKCIIKYPRFFTFGKFTKNGPTEEQIQNSGFENYIIVKGWKKEEFQGKEPSKEPTEVRALNVKGPEAAYDATSTFIVISAITILDLENENLCQPGVLTPGLAFRKSKLIERLRRNRIEFNLINI